jgi:hypothetical protein
MAVHTGMYWYVLPCTCRNCSCSVGRGLDGVGVGVVRGYGHGTTGGSGTEEVWVANLQDKCLAAGRPPAPDFLRMLSKNAVRESQSSV